MTALHLAAKIGNLTATQIMLDFYRQSMAISRLAIFINSVDDGRWSALVWAAENGHTDIVAYLLRLDADVTLCDTENNTVLHWAVLSGKLETLLPILRKNVNINGQNMNGDTAL
jgi:[histone H3]-lysine9 N-trimethyltransferase EHMT